MVKNRVWETATTTGTGNFTLLGAAEDGYNTFSSAFGTDAAYYIIVNRKNPTEWEIGSYTVSGATLARVAASVLDGSAGAGTKVSFTAGTKDVFNALPASATVTYATQSATDPGSGGSIAVTSGMRLALRRSGNAVTLHGFSGNCVGNCNCDCRD